jgi:hypothetical protein
MARTREHAAAAAGRWWRFAQWPKAGGDSKECDARLQAAMVGAEGAAMRTSAGEEARRRLMLALHDGSGGAPGSGSGSSAAQQDLLAEKRSV